jgi:hypothetical protein
VKIEKIPEDYRRRSFHAVLRERWSGGGDFEAEENVKKFLKTAELSFN